MTVERAGSAEAYDCKWGARGIGADVLNQLDDARAHAADEEEALERRARRLRWRHSPARSGSARQTAPTAGIDLVSLESLDVLSGSQR